MGVVGARRAESAARPAVGADLCLIRANRPEQYPLRRVPGRITGLRRGAAIRGEGAFPERGRDQEQIRAAAQRFGEAAAAFQQEHVPQARAAAAAITAIAPWRRPPTGCPVRPVFIAGPPPSPTPYKHHVGRVAAEGLTETLAIDAGRDHGFGACLWRRSGALAWAAVGRRSSTSGPSSNDCGPNVVWLGEHRHAGDPLDRCE
jgi:hypothetical protein